MITPIKSTNYTTGQGETIIEKPFQLQIVTRPSRGFSWQMHHQMDGMRGAHLAPFFGIPLTDASSR